MANPSKTRRVASPWDRDRVAEREEKREAVLHAAAQAFGENGYHRTSLDDIANRLGVTKPTIYLYAKNKEDLVFAVAERPLNQIIAAFEEGPDSSGLERLKRLLRAYAEVVATDFGKCLVELADRDLGPDAREHLRVGKKKITSHIHDLISLGIKDGSIGPCDVRLTTFMLAGALNGIARWYREGVDPAPAALAEIYVDQLATGLTVRSEQST